MKAIIFTLMTYALLMGCQSTNAKLKEHSGFHVDGERVGLHGMVLFGKDFHYLSHIPTHQPPHNEQLILLVKMKDANGQSFSENFSPGQQEIGFTVRPSESFSLDDLALGNKTKFVGDIHSGSFEQGGLVAHENIEFEVRSIVVKRNLPAPNLNQNESRYFLIGTAQDSYLVNYINDSQPYQQILHQEQLELLPGMPELKVDRAIQVNISAGNNNVKSPLSPSDQSTVSFPSAGGTARNMSVTFGKQLWCVKGPGYFDFCD